MVSGRAQVQNPMILAMAPDGPRLTIQTLPKHDFYTLLKDFIRF